MPALIAPYGGKLLNLMATPERVAELKGLAMKLPSWDLTPRQFSDLELLMTGALSPLGAYMGQEDYARVLQDMRLAQGLFWPLPIVLDVDEAMAGALKTGDMLALRDQEGVMLAVVHVAEIWRPDLKAEAQALFGTSDERHPGVARFFRTTRPVYVAGRVEGVELPAHHSFQSERHSPGELRQYFQKHSWKSVLALHSRTPLHKAQHTLATQWAGKCAAHLLIHPVIEEGEDYYYRARCYRQALNYFPRQTTLLSLLPVVARYAGEREILWHAIIRQNYGCHHMLWELPQQGGSSHYYEHSAEELAKYRATLSDELAIQLHSVPPMLYVQELAEYLPRTRLPKEATVVDITDEELMRRLRKDLDIPSWFTYPEVAAELKRHYPPRFQQGFTLFFTGLSGAGKSTIARAVLAKLLELGGRPVSLLDGDVVRKHLSSELGFSREHRDLNIRRIGYVASEITKNGGIAICAPIAPYREVRREVREMIGAYGGFIEIHVSTPLQVCEQRDRKGLYAKARAGVIKGFTGISDPYEVPEHPELSIDTSDQTVDEAAQRVFIYLEQHGYIV